MPIPLDQAVKSYVVLLDTCFAMSNVFKNFLDTYEQDLKKNKIKVPTVVIGELENRAKHPHPDSPNAQDLARKAVGRINKAIKKGLIEIVGDVLDAQTPRQIGAADAVFVSRVNQILLNKPVLVLTRDSGLKKQLESLTQSGNYAVKDLLIVSNITSQLARNPRPSRSSVPRLSVPKKPIANPFNISTTLERNLDTHIVVRETLGERSFLKTKNGQSIVLSQKLAEGGEGSVYEIKDSSLVCKIYHTSANNYHLTEGRKRKIELMLTRTISDPQICYPRSAVYDLTGTFRGFTMPKASGEPLGRGLFHPSFSKTHPNWNRKHSTQLALTILRKIEKLHGLNILIGDINPLNILVVNENKVYFVDCDSYQVEGFPCPVGTPAFTAPEIQGKDFKNLLRTKEHELFAVATLLFMIFMPGKAPYGHEGGEGVAENIKAGHFPYAVGDRNSVNAPKGPWRHCWSHLSRPIKDAFNQCFHIDERGKGRIEVSEWIRLMRHYQFILNKDSYLGPQMKTGFDLCILPQNLHRVLMKDTGQIMPPLRIDGKTDQQFHTEKLIAEMTVNGKKPQQPLKPHKPKPPNQPPPPFPQKTLGQTLWDWFFN